MNKVSHPTAAKLHFDQTSFESYERPPGPPAGHVHEAVEISAFECGAVTMLYGGQEITIPENRLVIHWGMLPHQAIRRDPRTQVVGIHLPLSWFLQWELPDTLTARLLNLELIIEPPRTEPCSDLNLLKSWHRLLGEYGQEGAPVVLTEIRARLLRLALSAHNTPDGLPETAAHPPPANFYPALQEIALHFREPLQIASIASKAGISPRHLTRIFHEYTGQTVNEYLTRLRLSHARRLLVTTGRTVSDIMYDSGFSCPTHFYKVFRQQTGRTPAQYRKRHPPE